MSLLFPPVRDRSDLRYATLFVIAYAIIASFTLGMSVEAMVGADPIWIAWLGLALWGAFSALRHAVSVRRYWQARR